MRDESKLTVQLDRDLLILALDAMIQRFIATAKAAGYSEDVIRTCTESELSLIDRIAERAK